MTTARTFTELVADVVELAPDHDPLDHLDPDGFAWLHDGMRITTSGVAARVGADDAHDALATIPVHGAVDLPGVGPVAVGALPFDPDAAAEVVVPAVTVATVAGRTFVTTVGGSPPRRVPQRPPTRFDVAAPRSPEQWRAAVDGVLAAIARGDVEKVVLAREVFVEADAAFDVGAIARRLTTQQPGSFVYLSDGFVGASPELLVRRTADRVESRPMAGTTVADGDAASLRALAESVKDQREHGFVVDAITAALSAACDALDVGAVPEVAVFGHVAHLATPLVGRLRAPVPDALALVRMLHPTPAVGGTPTRAALDLIARLEGFDRSRYAGPVGWMDARGDGEWAIALRGAEIDGSRARLVAGAGIVAGSDPDAEWAETQAKLEPMLRALVRP